MADDTFASPEQNVARRLAAPIEKIVQPGHKASRSELHTVKENADVIAHILPKQADQWTALSKLAETELRKHGSVPQSAPEDAAKTEVGPAEIPSAELYQQLETNRAEIGHWLWPLNKNFLPERHPSEDSPKPITSPEELHAYYLAKTQDATERSFHPIRHEQKVVGLMSCGLHDGTPGELQYWLGKEAGGKNVMSNALKAFERNAAVLRPGVEKLAAYIEDHQFASRQVFRKIGAQATAFTLDPVPTEWLKARPRLDPLEYNFAYEKDLNAAKES